MMYHHWNSFDYNNPHEKTGPESQHVAQRIANIEYRLNHLMETLLRQQQFYQQLHQAYFRHSNQLQKEVPTLKNLSMQQIEQSEQEKNNPEQPEPGVPSEKYKLPEQPRSVFIPPGVNGIVRM
jgi:hypothetical protein